MKSVNARLYALKYLLKNMLDKSIKDDNEAIKNGAKITFDKYAKIKAVKCTKKSYTKEAQELLDKYARENGLEKVETEYIRIEIDNIDTSIKTLANETIETLENDDNNIVKRVASKVARVK